MAYRVYFWEMKTWQCLCPQTEAKFPSFSWQIELRFSILKMHKLCRFDQRALKNWQPSLPCRDDFILLSYLLKVQSLTQLWNSQGGKICFLFLQEDRTLLGWQEQAAVSALWPNPAFLSTTFPLGRGQWRIILKEKCWFILFLQNAFPIFAALGKAAHFCHPWCSTQGSSILLLFWQNLSFLNLILSDFFLCSIFDAQQVPDFRAGPSLLNHLANRVASFNNFNYCFVED